MSEDKVTVNLEELAENNSLQLTALLELLEERGVLSRDEVLERMGVIQDRGEPRKGGRRTGFESARVEIACLDDGSKRLAQGINLSAGGLLVATADTVEEGSSVVVRFWVPEALQPIEPRGVVVRTKPGKEMAIRFVDLSVQSSQAITRCLVAAGRGA